MVILIDEVESYLHPRWQRSIVQALLNVATALNPQMHTQIISTTHSPLILASVEPSFDVERDKLFLFDLQSQVHFREVPWSKQGDTVNWLVSDVFGLKQARSWEAEQAIEAAEALMRRKTNGSRQHQRQRAVPSDMQEGRKRRTRDSQNKVQLLQKLPQRSQRHCSTSDGKLPPIFRVQ